MSLEKRIERLEEKRAAPDRQIVVRWLDGRLTVNGEEITEADLKQLEHVVLITVVRDGQDDER